MSNLQKQLVKLIKTDRKVLEHFPGWFTHTYQLLVIKSYYKGHGESYLSEEATHDHHKQKREERAALVDM